LINFFLIILLTKLFFQLYPLIFYIFLLIKLFFSIIFLNILAYFFNVELLIAKRQRLGSLWCLQRSLLHNTDDLSKAWNFANNMYLSLIFQFSLQSRHSILKIDLFFFPILHNSYFPFTNSLFMLNMKLKKI